MCGGTTARRIGGGRSRSHSMVGGRSRYHSILPKSLLTLTRSDRSSDLSSHGVERISMLTSPLSKGCRHSSSTTDTAEERHARHDLLASSSSPHHSSAFFPATAATKFEKSAIGKAVKARWWPPRSNRTLLTKGSPYSRFCDPGFVISEQSEGVMVYM